MEADEAAGDRFVTTELSASSAVTMRMGGKWISAVSCLGLVGTAYYGSVAAPQEPTPPGFGANDALFVKRTYAHIVKVLDDIGPTRGIAKETLPDGRVVEKEVEPTFGFGRMGVYLDHPGRAPVSMQDPLSERLIGIGAHGKPLTEKNLRAYNIKGREVFAEEIRQEVSQRIATINKGGDVTATLSGRPIWVKPLKLTKKECLPCHEGMKVGDTVGAIVFLTATD